MGQANVRALRATKHGAYDAGFMPCDRCNSNATCEYFTPKTRCWIEQDTFGRIVLQLTEEFELDTSADKILVERAAMYLIRIMRAEAYEAAKGMTDKTVQLSMYIGRLDSVLRGLFNDLAISRGKRKQFERGEALLVSLDEVVNKFAKAEERTEMPEPEAETSEMDKDQEHQIEKRRLIQSPRRTLLRNWRREYPKLRQHAKRRTNNGKGQAS
jgi:hypothetical protein